MLNQMRHRASLGARPGQNARVELERPYGRCACGGDDLEWLSGEELRIKELEVI